MLNRGHAHSFLGAQGQGRDHGASTASPGKPRPPQPRGPTDGAASGFAVGRGRAVNSSAAAPPVCYSGAIGLDITKSSSGSHASTWSRAW